MLSRGPLALAALLQSSVVSRPLHLLIDHGLNELTCKRVLTDVNANEVASMRAVKDSPCFFVVADARGSHHEHETVISKGLKPGNVSSVPTCPGHPPIHVQPACVLKQFAIG